MKLELLTNATVVDDAIRFVSKNSRDNAKLKSSSEGDKEESKEPDYEEEWRSARRRVGLGNWRNNIGNSYHIF